MTYYKKYTDDEAAKVARDLVEETQQNLEYVRNRVDDYGDTIAKRWCDNRNKKQREQLLVTSLPKISQQKWFQATLKEGMKRLKSKDFKFSTYRISWLLPYVNLELLRDDPMLLLVLLHYRSHHHSSEWVTFDNQQFRLPFEEAFLKAFFNPHCVIMYGERFGELAQWDETAAHRLEMIGFPRAQLILDSQNKLSGFLRGFIDKILGDHLNNIPKGRVSWQGLVAIGFSDRTTSVAPPAHYFQAFSPPPRFDIYKILNRLKARRDASEDEIYLLQADPMYAHEKLANLKSTNSYTQSKSKTKRHTRLVDAMVLEIVKLDNWYELIHLAELVKQNIERHEGKIRLGEAYPEDYKVLMRLLGEQLKGRYNEGVAAALELMRSSKTFEEWMMWDQEGNCHLKVKPEEIWRKDKLFWNFQFLRPQDQRLGCDQSFYLGFIDELLSLPSEKAHVDQELCAVISDMIAIDEALAALRYERPRVWGPVEPYKSMYSRQQFPKLNEMNSLSCTFFKWDDEKYATKLWKPLEAFIKAPRPSNKIDRSSITHLEHSHRALSHFWTEVRAFRKTLLVNCECHSSLIFASMIPIAIHLTKSYERDYESERNSLVQAVETKEHMEETRRLQKRTVAEPAAPVQTVWGDLEQEVVEAISALKVKEKTRPQNQTADAVHHQESMKPKDPKVEIATIAVSDETKDFFQRMFADYVVQSSGAKWEELVAAMVDAGFSSTHKGGSAVSFEDLMRGPRSIVVHKPHPDPTVDPVMLRSLGRRLRKRFGWSEQTFTVRDKQSL